TVRAGARILSCSTAIHMCRNTSISSRPFIPTPNSTRQRMSPTAPSPLSWAAKLPTAGLEPNRMPSLIPNSPTVRTCFTAIAAKCASVRGRSDMSSYLNQHVLVLNRLWQAVNICTARRALTLLFEGRAQVVLSSDDGSFQTYNFSQWHDFSQQEPHPESIHTISFRIRVPRVILLVLFDRLPKKEVKFTRH